MSFAEIKESIAELTDEQRAELIALLEGEPVAEPAAEDDAWDRQMTEDAEAGRLDGLVAKAKREYAAGTMRPLP